MARMTIDGLDGLINDLSELAKLPDSVTDDILNAEADVIVTAQQNEARTMWVGPYATGVAAASIKKGKPKRVGLDKSILIAPSGSRKRGNTTTRNAEIAFINEYGKGGQPARPAMRNAIEKKADEAVAAGEEAYHAYLDSKNL